MAALADAIKTVEMLRTSSAHQRDLLLGQFEAHIDCAKHHVVDGMMKRLAEEEEKTVKPRREPDKDSVRQIRDVPLQEGDWAVLCTDPGHFLRVHSTEFGKLANHPAYSYFRAKEENILFRLVGGPFDGELVPATLGANAKCMMRDGKRHFYIPRGGVVTADDREMHHAPGLIKEENACPQAAANGQLE